MVRCGLEAAVVRHVSGARRGCDRRRGVGGSAPPPRAGGEPGRWHRANEGHRVATRCARHRFRTGSGGETTFVRCLFLWNRDPATGLIFIQSGPGGIGSTLAFRVLGGLDGMLVVATIAKIRRAGFTLGKPIKEICRELRISRKVVRKVIRSNATEFHYERSRQPHPRIGPWRERLEALLEENESKAPRERLTLIRIYEDLRDLGYEGAMPPFVAMQSLGEKSARARRRTPMCRSRLRQARLISLIGAKRLS